MFIFFSSAFNSILKKLSTVWSQKIWNLLKAFQNRRYCHCSAFNSGGRCVARFSTGSCSLATYLPNFKIGKISPYRCATLRHLSSIRNKGFALASFEKLSANSKAFDGKRL
jgi:hypothetical protein